MNLFVLWNSLASLMLPMKGLVVFYWESSVSGSASGVTVSEPVRLVTVLIVGILKDD